VANPAFYFLISSAGGSAYNMACDEALLQAMPRFGIPVLRFYGWTEPAASFGYFQRIAEVERLTLLCPLVRRPTGGGIVPHDNDWTYSLTFPTSHDWYSFAAIESYRETHDWIRRAFMSLGVGCELAAESRRAAAGQCFLGHEKFDLLYRGQKIAGAAQRRTRDGLLIQGSVQSPLPEMERGVWETAMLSERGEPTDWRELKPDEKLTTAVEQLARKKYSQGSYNRKR